LKKSGAHPYVLPIGGSTAIGSLGCVNIIKEIAAQLPTDEKIQIVLPVGSCGTFAGLLLGARMLLPNSRIIGISISRSAAEIRKRSIEIVNECSALLNFPVDLQANDIECYDTYFNEYGTPTPEGQNAIIRSARLEGLLLDPVYTGKAMSGLIDLIKSGTLDPQLPTVFLHTGGLPVLFSYEPSFRLYANITIKKDTL
jgi:D-cysteine desulfhydrase